MVFHSRLALTALAATSILAVAGCGGAISSSSFQNARVNHEIRNGHDVIGETGPVTRFDTPGHFPAIVRICDGTEGLYVSESGTGIVTVVPQDPGCGFKGVSSGASNTTGPEKPAEGK